jgi:hypothetical protein
VERDGKDLRLSAREAELIEYLAQRPGEIVSREELLEEVWGYSASVVTRAVHYTMVRPFERALMLAIHPDMAEGGLTHVKAWGWKIRHQIEK